jgi:hypothetical protein
MKLEEWKAKLLDLYPAVRFTCEDGTGITYADERGDWTATVEPHDMQADVVGVYNVSDGYWRYTNGSTPRVDIGVEVEEVESDA